MSSKTTPKNLEMAHFIDELEARIVKRLQTEAATEESRAELLRSTGVEDRALVIELSKLGITADELIVMRLVPLVLVAWADDHSDLEEREVVCAQAKELGIQEDSTAWLTLDTWLRKRPPGIGVDAWRRYTHDLFTKMSPAGVDQLIDLTRKQMTAVAKATGGHLGLGKISHKEGTMIDRLTKIMREQSRTK